MAAAFGAGAFFATAFGAALAAGAFLAAALGAAGFFAAILDSFFLINSGYAYLLNKDARVTIYVDYLYKQQNINSNQHGRQGLANPDNTACSINELLKYRKTPVFTGLNTFKYGLTLYI
ncbi:hypothetical protein [Cellvibrio sp. UBA7661]|uniref:hypothetical protein n=1 Tax=Cellvibrio sp. UBA7661 TaxID=1946311 RepID=UPI002F357CE3